MEEDRENIAEKQQRESVLLTVKEKALELGISPTQLYRLVELKQIDHYRFGKKIKFDRHDPQGPNVNRVEGKVHEWN